MKNTPLPANETVFIKSITLKTSASTSLNVYDYISVTWAKYGDRTKIEGETDINYDDGCFDFTIRQIHDFIVEKFK